jgi:hypothetical protein
MSGQSAMEARLQELPAAQLEIANRILESVPAAHRPETLRLISDISRLPSPRDALIHLESIVSSENFRPSYLGTLSLIVERGGSNVTSALSEFSRLVALDKFNPHVARTARLAVIRAGENSHEALRGLYFLVSNPSFTPNSLTIALPDRFLSFLDQSIRAGGDTPYMAIRAMGSMFANSQFTPADLTVGEAREFATVLRQVQTWSRTNRLYAMDALCSLLANSAIRPQDLNVRSSREMGELVNIIVEYTRAIYESSGTAHPVDGGGPLPTIDSASRKLNLILGHGSFRLDMLSEEGLLNRAVNGSVDDVPAVLNSFYAVMRQSRRRPEVMSLAGHLMGQADEMGMDPLACLDIVDSLASNPRLAPLLSRDDFPQRLTSLLTTAGSSLRMLGDTESLRDSARILSGSYLSQLYLIPLMEMLRRDNFTPEAFGMLENMAANLSQARDTGQRGEGSVDIGIFLLNAALSRPGARPNRQLFSDITALSRQLRERVHTDYSGFASLLSSRFMRPDMMRSPDGLIPYLIRLTPPDQISNSANYMAAILSQLGNGEQALSIIRQLIRFGGRDTSTALYILRDLSREPDFTRRNYPALLELLQRSGNLSYFALNLYFGVFRNRALRPSLRSEEYLQRLARLIVRSRGTEPGEARQATSALASIMRDPRFSPEMIERLEYVSRVAGPNARHVFGYISSLLENSQTVLGPVLSQRFIQYLAGMAALYSTYGGRHAPALHLQFGQYIKDLGIRALEGPSTFSQVRSSFEALMRSAGPEAGSDALMCYALSIRHYVLSEDDSIAMGRFIRRELSGREGQARDEIIANLAGMFSTTTRSIMRIVIERPELYRRGRALARTLIPGCNDPAIFLNFAYGIDTVGEARVANLYRNFGLRYFARYSEDMLAQIHDNIGGAERPPVLVIFPHSDYNGAFYGEGRQFDKLLRTHSVVVYERADEQGFYQAVRDFRRRYGSTGTIIIGGHGSPTTITLGEGNELGQLDLSDEDELREIGTVLSPGGTVILDSCSTGASSESIGALISEVLGARLFAPQTPGNISQLHVSRSGRISATYTVAGRQYSAGTPVSGD